EKRRPIYPTVVEMFPDFNVFVGGSSSFDMAPAPFNKYYALDRFCKEEGYYHEDIVFIGDDYGLGGNDESVYKSDFDFITVDDYRDLAKAVEVLL
ncbi:MAG: phosphomannomutase, partial [Oscillospiraceae bacterium]|nr:phosphomannomutase [Oscillospiraceae bacterium]